MAPKEMAGLSAVCEIDYLSIPTYPPTSGKYFVLTFEII